MEEEWGVTGAWDNKRQDACETTAWEGVLRLCSHVWLLIFLASLVKDRGPFQQLFSRLQAMSSAPFLQPVMTGALLSKRLAPHKYRLAHSSHWLCPTPQFSMGYFLPNLFFFFILNPSSLLLSIYTIRRHRTVKKGTLVLTRVLGIQKMSDNLYAQHPNL